MLDLLIKVLNVLNASLTFTDTIRKQSIKFSWQLLVITLCCGVPGFFLGGLLSPFLGFLF